MHDDFSDWLRIATPELKNVDIGARWTGVEAFADEMSPSDLLNTVRLFYGLSINDAEFLPRFRRPFKDADDTFSMVNNNPEIAILAGATLIRLFSLGATWGDASALALVSASYCDQRRPAVGDIVRLARQHLAERSALLRSSQPIKIPVLDIDKHIVELKKSIEAATEARLIAEPIAAFLSVQSKTLGKLQQWADETDRESALRREESDVLWWLFGGQSRDLETPFANLKAPSACLVIAKELADLTSIIPGPYGSRAFLDKAITESQSRESLVTLLSVVGACEPKWRNSIASTANSAHIEDICPTLCAIRKSAESEGKKTWQPVFERTTGLKPGIKMAPADLAEQAYFEWMFLKALTILQG